MYSGTDVGAAQLLGKRLVVQATNIGYDVASDQFDLLIPGGGVGLFDACSVQLDAIGREQHSNRTSHQHAHAHAHAHHPALGKTYGGLLAECQIVEPLTQTNLTARKQCVRRMCAALYGSSPHLSMQLAGCHWFVDWYECADNPQHDWRPIPCPESLTALPASMSALPPMETVSLFDEANASSAWEGLHGPIRLIEPQVSAAEHRSNETAAVDPEHAPEGVSLLGGVLRAAALLVALLVACVLAAVLTAPAPKKQRRTLQCGRASGAAPSKPRRHTPRRTRPEQEHSLVQMLVAGHSAPEYCGVYAESTVGSSVFASSSVYASAEDLVDEDEAAHDGQQEDDEEAHDVRSAISAATDRVMRAFTLRTATVEEVEDDDDERSTLVGADDSTVISSHMI